MFEEPPLTPLERSPTDRVDAPGRSDGSATASEVAPATSVATGSAATDLAGRLVGLVEELASMTGLSGLYEKGAIDLLEATERVKRALVATRAAAVQVEGQATTREGDAGLPPRRRGKGVGTQVAMARRESPLKGKQFLGLAKILLAELPHAFAAMSAGLIGEYQATILARETAHLSMEHRAEVDAELGPTLGELGAGQLAREARRLAQRLDPAGAAPKAAKAEADRHVSMRPAPDTMTWVSALLPVAQGVAAHAALTRTPIRYEPVAMSGARARSRPTRSWSG